MHAQAEIVCTWECIHLCMCMNQWIRALETKAEGMGGRSWVHVAILNSVVQEGFLHQMTQN